MRKELDAFLWYHPNAKNYALHPKITLQLVCVLSLPWGVLSEVLALLIFVNHEDDI